MTDASERERLLIELDKEIEFWTAQKLPGRHSAKEIADMLRADAETIRALKETRDHWIGLAEVRYEQLAAQDLLIRQLNAKDELTARSQNALSLMTERLETRLAAQMHRNDALSAELERVRKLANDCREWVAEFPCRENGKPQPGQNELLDRIDAAGGEKEG